MAKLKKFQETKSIDLSRALSKIPPSQLYELLRSKAGQSMLSSLTPTQYAELFPDYYKRLISSSRAARSSSVKARTQEDDLGRDVGGGGTRGGGGGTRGGGTGSGGSSNKSTEGSPAGSGSSALPSWVQKIYKDLKPKYPTEPGQNNIDHMMRIVAHGETGEKTLNRIDQISPDTNNSFSYGILGINSKTGSAARFMKMFPNLGLTGTPGTKEFGESWKKVSKENPEEMLNAQRKFFEDVYLSPVKKGLKNAGLPEDAINNPKIIAYFADRSTQQGQGSTSRDAKHIGDAWNKSNGDIKQFFENFNQNEREYLYSRFRTSLRQGNYSERGNETRLKRRTEGALGMPEREIDDKEEYAEENKYESFYDSLPEKLKKSIGGLERENRQKVMEILNEHQKNNPDDFGKYIKDLEKEIGQQPAVKPEKSPDAQTVVPGVSESGLKFPLRTQTMLLDGHGRTSQFGYGRGRLHAGVDLYSVDSKTGKDLQVGKNAPVFAPSDGKIIGMRTGRGVGTSNRAGNWIEYRDKNGYSHRFLHTEDNPVNPVTGEPWKIGDSVKAGSIITHVTGSGTDFGRMADRLGGLEQAKAHFNQQGWGSTNMPHLHYEVRKNGKLINPSEIFPEFSESEKGKRFGEKIPVKNRSITAIAGMEKLPKDSTRMHFSDGIPVAKTTNETNRPSEKRPVTPDLKNGKNVSAEDYEKAIIDPEKNKFITGLDQHIEVENKAPAQPPATASAPGASATVAPVAPATAPGAQPPAPGAQSVPTELTDAMGKEYGGNTKPPAAPVPGTEAPAFKHGGERHVSDDLTISKRLSGEPIAHVSSRGEETVIGDGKIKATPDRRINPSVDLRQQPDFAGIQNDKRFAQMQNAMQEMQNSMRQQTQKSSTEPPGYNMKSSLDNKTSTPSASASRAYARAQFRDPDGQFNPYGQNFIAV